MTCSHGKTAQDECCDCDRAYYSRTVQSIYKPDMTIHCERLARVLALPCERGQQWDPNEGHGPEPEWGDGHYDEGGY